MKDTVLVGILSLLGGSAVGTVISNIASRRKSRAETDKIDKQSNLLDAQTLDCQRQLYEKMLKDNQEKLNYYINLSEENRVELRNLRKLVDQLIQHACLRTGCSERMFYEEDFDTLKSKEKES